MIYVVPKWAMRSSMSSSCSAGGCPGREGCVHVDVSHVIVLHLVGWGSGAFEPTRGQFQPYECVVEPVDGAVGQSAVGKSTRGSVTPTK